MAEEYAGVKFKTLFEGVDFSYQKERKELVAEITRLRKMSLIHGIPGNLSVRVPDGMVITPTGKDLAGVNGDDMVLVRGVDEKAGIVRTVGRTPPSSEAMMHWLIYKSFPKEKAIVHFHSDKLLANHAKFVGTEKARHYGTLELAHEALKALKKKKLIILKEHGGMAVGKDIATCHKMIVAALKPLK